MPEISVKSWNRFVTTNLCVATEVMGSRHEFEFEDHQVSVRLPSEGQADRDARYDEVARLTSRRSDTDEPLRYNVLKVDVEVTASETIDVPEEALSNPPKQVEYFDTGQQQVADGACAKLSRIAERAFQYWLEMVRWVSGDASIGQPSVSGFDSGWSNYLRDSSTNHEVWAGTQVFAVYMGTELTRSHWGKIAEHLQSRDELPMHLRFLHDAKASTRNGQYEKAIIELAMACEIYLRYSVFDFIPESTPEELKTYIEEANVNKYVAQFFKSLVPDSQANDYKKLSKNISSLMSRRNTYVHMGIMHDADEKLCRRFIDTAERLFKIQLDPGSASM